MNVEERFQAIWEIESLNAKAMDCIEGNPQNDDVAGRLLEISREIQGVGYALTAVSASILLILKEKA